MSAAPLSAAPRVVILADDLIWADRLAGAARTAGADPVLVRSLDRFEDALASTSLAIIDLTARAYDGVDAIVRARATGVRCLAVGQHDDLEMRKRALAAGADRVYAYRLLFQDGSATLSRWMSQVAETSRDD